MRENLVTLLELEGFKVLSAPNGRLGIEQATNSLPDLILCDVTMPVLDGYGVLQSLRSRPNGARVPFLFLTAKGERADIRSGMNLGADDYLVKPIARLELLEAISARLERQRVLDIQETRKLDFTSPKPLETLGLTPREADDSEARVQRHVVAGVAETDLSLGPVEVDGRIEAPTWHHVAYFGCR